MPDVKPEGTARKNARLMISYSRKDKVLVKQLHDGLLAQGFASEDIWVDWEGIPLQQRTGWQRLPKEFNLRMHLSLWSVQIQ